MNKQYIIANIAKKLMISETTCNRVLDEFFKLIITNDTTSINGFGDFSKRVRKQKKTINGEQKTQNIETINFKASEKIEKVKIDDNK